MDKAYKYELGDKVRIISKQRLTELYNSSERANYDIVEDMIKFGGNVVRVCGRNIEAEDNRVFYELSSSNGWFFDERLLQPVESESDEVNHSHILVQTDGKHDFSFPYLKIGTEEENIGDEIKEKLQVMEHCVKNILDCIQQLKDKGVDARADVELNIFIRDGERSYSRNYNDSVI